MNTIQAIGTGICITMIVTALFSLLITNRSMERVMRFALSLFFLTVLLAPLMDAEWSDLFDFSVQESTEMEQVQDRLEQSFSSLTKMQLQKQAQMLLEQAQIPYEKLSIEIHNEGQTSITISRLIVWLSDANLTAPAKDCLKDYFGIMPEIKVGEDHG